MDQLRMQDWKRELADFLQQYGRRRHNNFALPIGEETVRNRHDIVFSTVTGIMQDRHLKVLAQVTPRYIPRMLELWTAKGIAKRTQINYFNVMRWFWRVCGIEVPSIKTFETQVGEFTINRNATRDKSWKGNGVDFDEIYKKIEAIDPVAARLALLMKTYGLRLKEAIRMNPHESDGGDALLVLHGSKTGRKRQIPFDVFDDVNFRMVLDHLKDQVPEQCHLAWTNRTLAQAKARMRYIAVRVGLTKSQSGVVWHGLRHEFAIDKLEQLTGQTAPVRGGFVINYRALSDARRKVSEALGHHRLKITGAYYGSFLTIEREQLRAFTRSWEAIEHVLPEVLKLLQGNGVSNLYWIGGRAVGASGSNIPFEFALAANVEESLAWSLAPQLAELVLSATGIDCVVHPWQSMPGQKQLLWGTESIPMFEVVSPLDYMKEQLKEQKVARSISTVNPTTDM